MRTLTLLLIAAMPAHAEVCGVERPKLVYDEALGWHEVQPEKPIECEPDPGPAVGDPWYMGVLFGGFVVSPRGDDVRREGETQDDFETGGGFYFELPLDLPPYFTVGPFARFGFGAANTDLFAQRLPIDELNGSSLMQFGISGRFYPVQIGQLRPFLASGVAYTRMGVSKAIYTTSKRDCSDGVFDILGEILSDDTDDDFDDDCDPTEDVTESETVFSADYSGWALNLGGGLRYDFLTSDMVGKPGGADLFSLIFQVNYALNAWQDFSIDADGLVETVEETDLDVDHLWFMFGAGYLF